MLDFLLAQSVNVAIISLLVTALKIMGKVDISAKWSIVSLALFVSYFLALFTGRDVVPIELVFPDPSWNWGGKILGILLWVFVLFALVRLKEDFRPADAGFILKQNQASIKPAVVALGLFVLLQVLLTNLIGGAEYDTEELLFQASMPGLDEEPMFRGLLLYSLSLAFPSKRIDIFGAPINVAGLMLVVLFGLLHGLGRESGHWHFSAIDTSITGLYGFILLWFRERTGSLIFPIVAHNVVNFVGQFEFDF